MSGRSQPLDGVVCVRERVGLVEVSGWMVLCERERERE